METINTLIDYSKSLLNDLNETQWKAAAEVLKFHFGFDNSTYKRPVFKSFLPNCEIGKDDISFFMTAFQDYAKDVKDKDTTAYISAMGDIEKILAIMQMATLI